MRDYRLTSQEFAELRAAHRAPRDVREAYRINAAILLGKWLVPADVADALLVDADTAREYFKRYKQGGLDGLVSMSYVGRQALLDGAQLAELDAHLQDHLHLAAESVARWVEQRWGIRYTASGMTAVLQRLGYVYKKAKLEPGRHPDQEVREAFVEKYDNIEKNKADGDAIYFLDATHPQHNPVIGWTWIKRGKEHQIRSDTGRQRLNIDGAIDVQTLCAETIDAVSTVALLTQLEQANPTAPTIVVFCDNARYDKYKTVAEYLATSRIRTEPHPLYSPKLDLIERSCKFFKSRVICNRNYKTFGEFPDACKKFFVERAAHAPSSERF